MADKVSYKWSSSIGDWDAYWADREYWEERYGQAEFDGETDDGESFEDVQSLHEETGLFEPPAFIDWLIKFQNYGFSIERIWINRDSRPDRLGDITSSSPKVEITTATVEFSINPNASKEQKEWLSDLMQGEEVDVETGTICGAPFDEFFGSDPGMIVDPSLTGGSIDPTRLF